MQIEARHIRRLRAVSLVGIGFVLVVAYRLATLQAWDGESYSAQARSQHEKTTELKANRGRILDRHGRVLATNLEAESFFVNNVFELENLRAIAVRFSRRSGESSAEMLKRLRKNRSFVWLARKVEEGPPEEESMKGVGRMVEMRRSYPMGTLAGQVLGYTDIDNIGIEGIELAFDARLQGTPGEMLCRVDARGKRLGAFGAVRRMPLDGSDLVLTIDADYQSIVEEELQGAVDRFEARSGIAIVMEPMSGEVLAMANVPLYDPNGFASYNAETRRNRAVTDLFEPGSTFKVVALAGALEEGRIGSSDRIFCENGELAVAGGTIRDSHPSAWLTVPEVIEESSNIGTIKIGQDLGTVDLFRYIRLFGFGSITSVGLPGEVPGEAKHPTRWSKRSLETISIGQEIGVTALQMVSAYAAIANGGRLLVPRITMDAPEADSPSGDRPPEVIRQVVSPETAAEVTRILEGVVARGTGANARVAGYRVAGKTGTAQKALPGSGGYDPDLYNSSFIGFLPAERPEFLCAVIVDSPKGIRWGSQVAAPVFSCIVQRILSLRRSSVRHSATGLPTDGEYTTPKTPVLDGLPGNAATRVLNRNGLRSRFEGSGDRVVAQAAEPSVAPGEITIHLGSVTPADAEGSVRIPDVTGIPLRQAVFRLTSAGLHVTTEGSGSVVSQSPGSGQVVRRGTTCRVSCRAQSG